MMICAPFRSIETSVFVKLKAPADVLPGLRFAVINNLYYQLVTSLGRAERQNARSIIMIALIIMLIIIMADAR